MPRKKFKMPHVYTIFILLIVLAGLMTFIVPAGTYDRMTFDNGRSGVVPGTFHFVERTPVDILGWFTAIGEGFVASADIICGVFIYVAGIGMYLDSDVFNKAIFKLINVMGNKGEKVVMLILMIFYTCLGGLTGNITPELAFVPMSISLALAFGYDTMTGVLMVLAPTFVGFATGPINPYTIGVAHQVAELEMFSGMLPRICMWVVSSLITFRFVFHYAEKVKKDHSKSLGSFQLEGGETIRKDELSAKYANVSLTVRDWILLAGFVATVVWLVLGAVVYDYSMNQYTGIFIMSGIFAGIVAGFDQEKICKTFIKYGSNLYFGAMVLALARAIYVIFTKGQICDTIVYYMSLPLQGMSSTMSAAGMLVFQTVMNFFVNSGSGQAMVTMPIMTPLADILGVSRQVAVSAFQFGDGLSNLVWPTSSTIFAYLAMANLPYDKYLKAIWKLFAVLTLLAFAFVIAGQMLGYA